MALTYRRPGVYLSESLLINQADVASAQTVAAFVGVTGKGPINEPVLVESWSDYVRLYGSFEHISDPQNVGTNVLSYMPFAVYSYFQNGGRSVWIIRSAPSGGLGTASYVDVQDGGTSNNAFRVEAVSTGVWGDNLKYDLTTQDTQGSADVFAIRVVVTNSNGVDEVVETFSGLSMTGDLAGTRRVDSVVNDPASGSQFVRITNVDAAELQPAETANPVSLDNGVDPDISDASALIASSSGIEKVEGPIVLNIVGLLADAATEGTADAATSWVGATVASTTFTDRSDIFIINDNAQPRVPNGTSGAYSTTIQSTLGANSGDSFSAAYGPWIKVPHPARAGTVIDIPPGGAVAGVMARTDVTIGVFRAPAGVIAGISNAVGVATKFTDTELGDLNSKNINMIRSTVGAGITIMGARTRKTYGADRYVSARRTLIYVNEVLRRSTQFAVFENNDQRLWSALRATADRILRPLWEAGGLRGSSADQAYFIRCDETNNTPASIASGEVRMEVGVSLEYPAEFVIIRITQVDRGTFSAEVQPTS